VGVFWLFCRICIKFGLKVIARETKGNVSQSGLFDTWAERKASILSSTRFKRNADFRHLHVDKGVMSINAFCGNKNEIVN